MKENDDRLKAAKDLFNGMMEHYDEPELPPHTRRIQRAIEAADASGDFARGFRARRYGAEALECAAQMIEATQDAERSAGIDPVKGKDYFASMTKADRAANPARDVIFGRAIGEQLGYGRLMELLETLARIGDGSHKGGAVTGRKITTGADDREFEVETLADECRGDSRYADLSQRKLAEHVGRKLNISEHTVRSILRRANR